MADDAVLSIGAEDNLTPVLAKMAAQTRAFGQAIGAESEKIEKSVRGVTKSINDLNTSAGSRGKTTAVIAQTAKLTAELREQEAVMQRLSRASRVTPTASGRMRGADGRFVSDADVKAYDEARRAADAYSTRLEELNRNLAVNAQREASAAASTAARSQALRNLPGPSLGRESELLDMRAYMMANAGATIQMQKSWFPPEVLKGPKAFADVVAQASNSVRYAMYDVSRSAAIGGAAFLALSVGAVVAAARWERAFADVQRTVQATPSTLEEIRQGLISLSQDIPVSFTALSEIASVGGQMGIAADGIVAYTETIAKLTATTNLTADAATKALGRFKSFFAEASDPTLAVTDQTFSNLASSILKVGVNSVATESGIVNVATQISSMGTYAGLTADQVIGLSGALSSVGVPPELSRGVITRLFNTIGESVSEGGSRLQAFADLAGVSAQEFQSAWGTDQFAYLFTDMVAGLGEVSRGGGDAVQVLHELGITSVRDVPVLLRLASAAGEAGTAGSLLAQTMNDARSGWRQNIELTLQYNKIADTLSERTKVLFQNFEALFATIGAGAVGPVKEIVNGVIDLVKGFTALASNPAAQQFAVTTIAAGALAGVLLLVAAGAARSFAAMQGLHAGLVAVTGSSAVATAAVRGLGIAMSALGVVAAVGAVIGIFAAMAQGSEQANNAITDTQGAVAALKRDTEAGGYAFRTIGGAAGEAAKSLEETSSQAEVLAGITSETEERLYGAGDAADNFSERITATSFAFGKASQQFVRNALLADKAFTDLFLGSEGVNLGDNLIDTDFNLDTLIARVARGGRESGEKYLQGLLGVKPNANGWEDIGNSWAWMDQNAAALASSSGAMLDRVVGSVEAMDAAGRAALSAGDGILTFKSAADITTDSLEEFRIQNEDTINSMADGYAKFVSTGSLIGLTQQLEAAYATMDDGTTEVDEHAEALAGFERAWVDAYGGAAFSIDSYMAVFRRAAEEQQTFTSQLQTLMSRGLDRTIVEDLAEMGPQAAALVQALIDGTDAQLQEYEDLYGRTGFDSMVQLAAGQLAAEHIVKNVMSNLGIAGVQELNQRMTEGASVYGALAEMQLQADGNPVEVPADPELSPGWRSEFQSYFNQGVSLPVTPYLTKTKIALTQTGSGGRADLHIATGGLVRGPGTGTSDSIPARVSNGEFVMTAAATRAIGPDNLYALMNAAQSGRVARPSGGGYAAGGLVSSANSAGNITHLSVEDRMLLMEIRDAVGVTIAAEAVGAAANAVNSNGTSRRIS